MTSPAVIGIDLGGTNLKLAVVDQDGRIRARHVCAFDAASGPDRAIAEIAGVCDVLLRQASTDRSALAAVGVGVPGPLDLSEGVVVKAANLPGWEGVPLRNLLAEEFKCPVAFDNDGNAAAFGEYRAGSGKGVRDLVMLMLGTGVGAGVILDGKLVHGHFDNAAELGHTIVVAGGLRCACGQRGCLEQYASASGIARRVRSAVAGGRESTLSRAVNAGGSPDAADVVHHARAGDALCLEIWDEACMYIALACINIQHSYNPARVVLGGGMSRAGAFLLDRVRVHIHEQRWSLHDDLPTVTLATLGYDAGVIGAACLAWRTLLGSQGGGAS